MTASTIYSRKDYGTFLIAGSEIKHQMALNSSVTISKHSVFYIRISICK
jgi:hypothetical protein